MSALIHDGNKKEYVDIHMEEQLHRVVEFKTEAVSSDIIQQLLGEVMENMFSIRCSNEKENKGETSLTTKQILFEAVSYTHLTLPTKRIV